MGTLQFLPPIEDKEKYLAEIRNRHVWLLKMGGEKVMYLKRRWEGDRCTACWDSVRRQSTKEGCLICYGTGFVGGYYNPIEMTVSLISPASKKVLIQDHGMIIERMQSSWTLWEPQLQPRDIFVLMLDGRRIEVTEVTPTKWRGIILRQNFEYREIEETSIAYKIPIPV